MGLREKVSYIIYRYASRGLEVFVLDDSNSKSLQSRLPQGHELDFTGSYTTSFQSRIELEHPDAMLKGTSSKVIALEADWHELPTLREAIGDDVDYVKSKVMEISSDFEKGTYIGIKEAFKKVMPHEYALLKELKDILLDKNTIENI